MSNENLHAAKARYQKASDAWVKQKEVDIAAKRAEEQKLAAEMRRLEAIKTDALNSGRVFVTGTREFNAFRYATSEQAKIREPLKNVRLIIAQYEAAKKEFEDSQRALAEAIEANKR